MKPRPLIPLPRVKWRHVVSQCVLWGGWWGVILNPLADLAAPLDASEARDAWRLVAYGSLPLCLIASVGLAHLVGGVDFRPRDIRGRLTDAD